MTSTTRSTLLAVLVALCTTPAVACAPPPVSPPPAPTSFVVTTAPGTVALSWQVPPGPAPASFVVETRMAGQSQWSPGAGTLDVARRRFVALVPPLDDILTLQARVTSVGATGLRSAPSTTVTFDLPMGPEGSTRFRFGQSQMLADRDQLVGVGLDTFPDGLVSLLPTGTPGVYAWYANQGLAGDGNGGILPAGIAQTRGTLSDPLQSVTSARAQVRNMIAPVDYAGAGAVWRDAAPGGSGGTVMLYHRESWDFDGAGRPSGAFWSSIGAAWSSDGVEFTDLGEVITPAIGRHSPNRGPSGSGPGDLSLLVRGSHLYAYMNDNLPDGSMVLTVARTTLAEMQSAATGAAAPVFHKWDGSDFTAPGIGGLPASVLPSGFNPSVVRDGCTGRYLMLSHYTGTADGTRLQVSSSADGVTWTTPQRVPGSLSGYRIYNTLLGDQVAADGQVTASPGQLRIFSTRFAAPTEFWSSVQVHSIPLVDALSPSGCTG